MTPNWKTILNDIEKERAVLLIGQDFMPSDNDTPIADFYEHLYAQIGDGVQYFYDRDGLFLFDNSLSKVEAQQSAEEFYNGLRPEETILQCIAEIPFPLIVSVNPDLSLPQFLTKHQMDFQFDYFSTKNKAVDNPLVKPTASMPLVYNLCGTIEDYQSLVLDFDDLFDLLKNLLGDFGIPKVVNDILVNATTYIFIGFKFEKWYTQLLLRYLNKNASRFVNTSRNHALKTVVDDNNTQAFFQKQFNLTIYGTDFQFLIDLHAEYKAQKTIRPLLNPISDKAALVRRLVRFNNLEGALEKLDNYAACFDQDDRDMITILKSNYRDWQDNSNGSERTRSTEDLLLQLNRIRKAILDFTSKLS
jgi:Effector-associated domain 11/SIR2-like domain